MFASQTFDFASEHYCIDHKTFVLQMFLIGKYLYDKRFWAANVCIKNVLQCLLIKLIILLRWQIG